MHLLAPSGELGSELRASAEPAEESPIGGHRAHPHHVHTGNCGCIDLDQHLFEVAQGDARTAVSTHRGGAFHRPRRADDVVPGPSVQSLFCNVCWASMA